MRRDDERAMDGGAIAEIDGLRGLAITWVMLHRLWPRDALAGTGGRIAEAGWIGVDLFFVISGYLITRILLSTRGEPDYFRNFYARRVLRIFPLYYVFVGAQLLLFSVGTKAAWYLLFLGNVPEGLLGFDPPYWLAPVWSLAIEEQFYLTFPWLVRRFEPRQLARVLVGLFLLAPLARAVTMALAPGHERVQYLFTLCRVDAIAAGCLIAVLLHLGARLPRRVLGSVVAGAAVIALASGLDRTTAWGRLGGYSVVALGFAALVVLVLGARDSRATAVLRVPPLRYVGKLCFGLYLLHRPADTIVTIAAGKLGYDAATIACVALKIAVAVGLASLSWFTLERPLLRLKRYFRSAAHPSYGRVGRAGAGVPAGAGVAASVTASIVLVLAGCNGIIAPAGSDGGGDHRHDGSSPVLDARGDGPADAPPGDAPLPATARVLYAADRTQSPITAALAQHLAAISAAGQGAAVFAKVGDSITASTSFASCFDAGPVDLGARADLQTSLDYFRHGNAAGTSPFARTSLAAQGGWQTSDELAGAPCPLDSELGAIAPRESVILLGTNDDRYGRSVIAYGADLWTIVDRSIARGAIPVVSTLPPMYSDPDADARVLVFNDVVRAIAQGRGIPLVDLHRELVPLPGQGISSDGIHPTVDPSGACILSAAGLQYGYNVRNLITLDALDRVRRALAGAALDASAPVWQGTGAASAPLRSPLPLPLVDLGDTHDGGAGACGAHQMIYRFDLAAPSAIDAYVISRGGTLAQVRLLSGAFATCPAGATTVSATLPAGPAYAVVDAAQDGEYVLVVRQH